VTLSPYAGICGDLPITPVFAGWSARTDAGIAAQFASGGQLTLGSEPSGLGGSFSLWTYRARASIPFSAQ
jgi:hypothetical protein